ncbi:MAG: flagellar filament capping protein FliD [Acidobacteriota bacterium]
MATISSTSSTAGPALTSLGVGSGLDAETIVTKLVALERQPITQLQTQASKIQSKISVFGKIQSAVSTLRDAAAKLTSPDLWSSTTATSSDSSVAFTTSAGAVSGNYNVSVSALAAGQAVVSKTILSSSAATLGAGTLTLEVGSWSAGAFTGKTGTSAVNVTIDAADSLETIRDKINGSGAGVKASIINDASGARLVMNSATTGASNGFRVTTTDADGNNTDAAGLSALAYDPASSTAGTTLTQAASNAAATVNGVDITSESNTFSNVLTGISIAVNKVTTAPVSVAVAQDNTTITKAITDFATAYSALDSLLKTNTKYDDSTKTAAALQGDSTAISLISQLRSMLGSNTTASTVFTNLSSIGLETQSGGALTVNNTKLTSALGNLAEMKKMFAAADLTGGGADGIATKFRSLADNLLGVEGAITTRTAGLNTSVTNNQKRQDALEARSVLYEKRLRAQYTALDKTMATISTQSSYVTQMISAYNKTSNSS